jgi:hypothetical protein
MLILQGMLWPQGAQSQSALVSSHIARQLLHLIHGQPSCQRHQMYQEVRFDPDDCPAPCPAPNAPPETALSSLCHYCEHLKSGPSLACCAAILCHTVTYSLVTTLCNAAEEAEREIEQLVRCTCTIQVVNMSTAGAPAPALTMATGTLVSWNLHMDIAR